MQDWAPQAMLFGLAIDLALLGTVHLRLWKDRYKLQLLSLTVILGLGALLGLIWSDLSSPKAEMALVVYEALLPFFIFLQLARFLQRTWFQYLLLPVGLVVAFVALSQGWGFQSTPMLTYEVVILLVQVCLVIAWSLKGIFLEEELLFILGAQALLLVLGPGYGFMWPGLGINSACFAIAGAVAGGLIVLGRTRSSYLHFIVPGSLGPKMKSKKGDTIVPAGMLLVPRNLSDEVKKAFEKDLKIGRIGLWISMEPVSQVLGKKRTVASFGTMLAAQLTHSSFVENSLDPMDTGAIKRSLAEYLKMTGNGMIFIQDMHYLVSNTDIWEITELLKFLKDKAPSKRTSILIGSDLLDNWEMSYLRKAGAKDWPESISSP